MYIFGLIAKILAGLGLMFFGRALFSSNLRTSLGPKFNNILYKSTETRFRSMLCGVVISAIFTKPSIVILIVAGLVSAGLLTVRKVYPFLIWSNVGTVLLLYMASIDIETFCLLTIGVTGVWLGFTQSFQAKKILTLIFGIALVFLGISFLKTDLTSIQFGDTVEKIFRLLKDYPPLFIPLVFLVRLVTQSSFVVGIVAMNLYAMNAMNLEGIIYMNAGFMLAKLVSFWLISMNLRGTAKQFAMLQNIYLFSMFILLITLNTVENLSGVPMIKAFVESTAQNPYIRFVNLVLIFHLINAITLSLAENTVIRFVEKYIPPDEKEGKSEPKYLLSYTKDDPDIALELIQKEHLRMLTREVGFIGMVKNLNGEDESNNQSLQKRIETDQKCFESLAEKVREFTVNLKNEGDLSPQTLSHFHETLDTHALIVSLQRILYEIYLIIDKKEKPSVEMIKFSEMIFDTLEFFLLQLLDVFKNHDPEEAKVLTEMLKGKLNILEQITDRRFGKSNLSDQDWEEAVHLTITTSKATWTIKQIVSALSFRSYQEEKQR